MMNRQFLAIGKLFIINSKIYTCIRLFTVNMEGNINMLCYTMLGLNNTMLNKITIIILINLSAASNRNAFFTGDVTS